MKVLIYMAMSLNGFIADENGEEEFLSHENWQLFCNLAQKYHNFIVGRKTFDAVSKWSNGYGFDGITGVKKIVISNDPNFKLGNDYICASSPQDALAKLQDMETALVVGGSTLNTSFIKAGLVDQFIINIEPAIVGRGVPIFAPAVFAHKLQLLSSSISPSGILTLEYKFSK